MKPAPHRTTTGSAPARPRPRGHVIIPRDKVSRGSKTCIIGGDSAAGSGDQLPTIVLEKDAADAIVRIVVRCPCGRTAELLCGYE